MEEGMITGNEREVSMQVSKDRVRLSLDVSPELNATLDRLVDEMDAGSKSEVLRRAIALIEVAVDAKKQGKRLGLADKGQPLSTELVGI